MVKNLETCKSLLACFELDHYRYLEEVEEAIQNLVDQVDAQRIGGCNRCIEIANRLARTR